MSEQFELSKFLIVHSLINVFDIAFMPMPYLRDLASHWAFINIDWVE